MNRNCSEIQARLSEMLAGTVGEMEANALRAHAEECEGCGQRLRLLEEVETRLGNLSGIEVPDRLAEQTLTRLRAERLRQPQPGLSIAQWLAQPLTAPAWAWAGCFVVVAALSLLIRFHESQSAHHAEIAASPGSASRSTAPAPSPQDREESRSAVLAVHAKDPAWTFNEAVASAGLQAQRHLPFEGSLVLLLKTSTGTHALDLHIIRTAKGAARIESLTGDRAIYVLDGDAVSRYSEEEGRWMRADFVAEWPDMKSDDEPPLRYSGEDEVAGRQVQLYTSSSVDGGEVRRWVDRDSGLPLRLERRNAEGTLELLLEFYDIRLGANPSLNAIRLPVEATRTLLAPGEGNDAPGTGGGLAVVRSSLSL